jgi:hypothetical protein
MHATAQKIDDTTERNKERTRAGRIYPVITEGLEFDFVATIELKLLVGVVF